MYVDRGEARLRYAAAGRCWQTKDKDAEKQTEKQYVQCFTTIKHWFRPAELYNAVFYLIGWVIGAQGQVYDFYDGARAEYGHRSVFADPITSRES